MKDWLRRELTVIRTSVAGAYIFGSYLAVGAIPRDIDVILISVDGAGGMEWHRVRAWRDEIVPRFKAAFGLPLSVMVVTPSEWAEVDGVIVREREDLL